ncbi:MAG: hypothetical protein ACRDL5_15065, partial [Solirubrobacteraceae bacterium]
VLGDLTVGGTIAETTPTGTTNVPCLASEFPDPNTDNQASFFGAAQARMPIASASQAVGGVPSQLTALLSPTITDIPLQTLLTTGETVETHTPKHLGFSYSDVNPEPAASVPSVLGITSVSGKADIIVEADKLTATAQIWSKSSILGQGSTQLTGTVAGDTTRASQTAAHQGSSQTVASCTPTSVLNRASLCNRRAEFVATADQSSSSAASVAADFNHVVAENAAQSDSVMRRSGSTATATIGGAPRRSPLARLSAVSRPSSALKGALAAAVSATAGSAATAKAVLITRERLAGAIKAKSSRGTALQTAMLAASDGELASALKRENAADRSLAVALRRAHGAVEISSAQSKAGIAAAEHELERFGIPSVAARALAPRALTPHKFSLTQALGAQVKTAMFTRAQHQLKRSGVIMIIAALRAQHLLSRATAAALTKATKDGSRAAFRRGSRRASGSLQALLTALSVAV